MSFSRDDTIGKEDISASTLRAYAKSAWAEGIVGAPQEAVFDYLDDPARLGAHMRRPSLMMLGGGMDYALDEGRGKSVGSVIRMHGDFLWFRLEVVECVIERDAPRRKTWRTLGKPSLIVIGSYEAGFDLEAIGGATRVGAFFDYDPPERGSGPVSEFIAERYAHWCVSGMVRDARAHFLRVRQ